MIIRIMSEGQYELAESDLEPLNALDAELEAAVLANDTSAFEHAFTQLLRRVREHGTTLSNDALVDSDLVLPPSDATLDEVSALLGDEGLIPG